MRVAGEGGGQGGGESAGEGAWRLRRAGRGRVGVAGEGVVDLVDSDRFRQVHLGVPQVELEVFAVLRQARIVRAGAVRRDLSRGHRAVGATRRRRRQRDSLAAEGGGGTASGRSDM